MDNDTKKKIILLFIVALLISAIVIDRYLPNSVIVVSLYSLPILLAAFFYSARTITFIGVAVIIIFIIEEVIEKHTASTILSGVLGFLIITVLGIQFSYQRLKALHETQQAKEARKKLQIFLGMVAHDLYQPITAIKLNTALIEKDGTNKERLRKNIEFSVHQAQHLVEDLRDAAAIESGNFSIKKSKTDIVDVIRKVTQQQKSALSNGNIKFAAPKKLVGEWDKERMAQLFMNIISNAAKYSRERKEIGIKITPENRTVLVRITDNGLGMTKKQLRQVFEPFTRFHKETAKGTGLGLYISYWIVTAHKGTIWAESTVGKGTAFFVRLPLKG